MIRLAVNGTPKSARREAARHGVAVRNVTKMASPRGAVYADTPCKNLSKVMRWYGTKPSLKPGRGSPPGTLTFYSTKSCAADEMRGLDGPSAGKLALYIGAPAALLGAVYLIMRAQADGATPSPGAATPPSFVPTTRSGPGHF